jgi:lipopolysaccharide transport system ATP-binding protein
MNNIAIRVENLSKLYRIGARQEPYRTLRDTLAGAASAPFRRIRSTFQRAHGESVERSNEFWALKDVSCEVKRGEVVGIIGRTGAGKSTLLKILSRITEPTSGYADIYGRIGSLLEVGTGFHPELTGRENIYLNGAILGMKRAEIDHQFDAIVAFAEVEQFVDTAVKHYSSGMYLRLAFAVAAHLEPEILLVDEVLAVGDAQFQKKCLGKMSEVAKEGRTIFFVSHNMGAIQQLCSRAFLIRSGSLCKEGTAEEIIADYLSDAVRSENGIFDYSDHPARPSTYTPLIKRLTVRSSKGLPTTFFYPDDSLQVELLIETKTPIREPRLALAIEDNLDRRILTVASYFQTHSLSTIENQCRVVCTLPNLCLGAGRYLISVSIGTKYQGLLDSVDGGAWFEVGWNNNYGNGEPYHSIYGPVLTDSTWERVE